MSDIKSYRTKYIRTYEIEILTPDNKSIIIEPPFSMNAKINRNVLSSANKASLTIINLSESTRNSIYKDRYSLTDYWQLKIKVGYGNRLYQVFKGNILESYSSHEGTEWVTRMSGFDGLYAIQNGFINESVPKDTLNKDSFKKLLKQFPKTLAGTLSGNSDDKNKRGKVLMGKTSDVLAVESKGKYFINNEVVNIIDDDEVLEGETILIDRDQILTSPRRRNTFLDCDIILEPTCDVGLYVKLDSSIEIYNGQYKMLGFSHDITISSAKCGTSTTIISLDAGAEGLRVATP